MCSRSWDGNDAELALDLHHGFESRSRHAASIHGESDGRVTGNLINYIDRRQFTSRSRSKTGSCNGTIGHRPDTHGVSQFFPSHLMYPLEERLPPLHIRKFKCSLASRQPSLLPPLTASRVHTLLASQHRLAVQVLLANKIMINRRNAGYHHRRPILGNQTTSVLACD